MDFSSISLRPEASNAWASCRAPCTGTGPIAATPPLRLHAICTFIPVYFALPSVRDCVPVPHRADGAVYQGSSLAAEHPDGIGDIKGENLADYRAQQVPPPADRRLAAMEMRCCGSLGCIAAHQHDDHDHRVEQSDRRRLFRAGLDQRADLL